MLNLFKKNAKWWALFAMSSALALVFIDQTALAVALPAMQRDLNLSNNLLSWIVNGYLLSLSTLVLFGGKLGDSFGHKKNLPMGTSYLRRSLPILRFSHFRNLATDRSCHPRDWRSANDAFDECPRCKCLSRTGTR